VADRLYRSRDDRMLAGVAAGVAEMVEADPSIIRVVWVLLAFLTGGLALVAYIVMAIVVPERPYGEDAGGDAAAARPAAPDGPVAPGGGWIAPDGSVVPMAGGTAGAPGARPARDRPAGGGGNGALIGGMILILIGVFFLLRQVVPSIDLGLWWPLVAIALGLLLVVLAFVPSRRGG
jgi:phage shock protein C